MSVNQTANVYNNKNEHTAAVALETRASKAGAYAVRRNGFDVNIEPQVTFYMFLS